MTRFATTPSSRQFSIRWLAVNAFVLVTWLLIAWLIWPWPDYGYCDIPMMSWEYVFDTAPKIIALIQFVVLLVATIRAIKIRDVAVAAAVLITATAWYALAAHNFNPNAEPGNQCWA